ncbi:DUF2249 domain-containing protein [Chitinophaga flava]|uniref:DUF2249 domain-containing protein n=1 Tax=Chitinophaga flava TaxID=2259036 RepID=A0A365Y1H8_9BACT|nr:DUF2249 domain-containing protein [Chitinophaga flava]RBL91695.1 hypothetical protein DF182_03545 [Chitinophaga flava]
MMHISNSTRISALIAANAQVIDQIAAISPHFRKLKNPLLRKVLAPRVTIAEAAKIGNCSVEDIYAVLRPLGFIIDAVPQSVVPTVQPQHVVAERAFNHSLDVREMIAAGHDPFQRIMQEVRLLEPGQTLLLINSFEPTPLFRILQKQGFEMAVRKVDTETVYSYITKISAGQESAQEGNAAEDLFQVMADKFCGRFQKIDVRALPMPQPMVVILQALETLPENMALFVEHKKVPLFLLPELKERQYAAVHRLGDQGVQLIIYKT